MKYIAIGFYNLLVRLSESLSNNGDLDDLSKGMLLR